MGQAWYDDFVDSARTHGAMPYLVEGFTEISDAVRRGHSVVVRRERAEVADDLVVFDDQASAAMVAILRFELSTARYVIDDATNNGASIELTPRRLATYLSEPSRTVGVALGA